MTHSPLDNLARNLALIESRLEGLPSTLRQDLANELWSKIPALVDEYNYAPALAPGQNLDVPAAYGTAITVTSVVVAVPAGSSGLLTLGSASMPIPGGTVTSFAVRKLLGPNDTRRLTIAGGQGGACALWLSGEQAPTYGVI